MEELERTVAGALRDSGGTVSSSSGIISASFDDEVLAFWLDLMTALEGIDGAIARADKELMGRSCLVATGEGEKDKRKAMLFTLSQRGDSGGIWCERAIAARLSSYASFGADGDVMQLVSIFPRPVPSAAVSYWIRPRVAEDLSVLLGGDRSAVSGPVAVLGQPHSGKRQAVRCVLEKMLGGFPAYVVNFGCGGASPACFADAITDEIAVLMDSVADKKRDRAAADKFRRAQADRLRETCSRATFDSFAAAFAAVADDYIAACDARKLPAAFVLENFHLANGDAARLAVRVLGAVSAAGRAMVVLTGTGPETLRAWRESPLHAVRVARVEPPSRAEIAVMATAAGGGDADSLAGFDALVLRACEDAARGGLGAARRVLVGWIHDPDGFPVRVPEALTDDLLEIAYAARQLRSAFPAAGLEPIFRAEGKPAGTWRRALVSLADLGVITSVADPEPAIACFDAFVEARIPRKCESIRSLVRRVLLDAAEAKRLLPSYGLLREIARLGGGAGDDLALDAIEEEVSLGTGSNVLSAITEGHFEAAVGKRLASSLESLVRTRNVLSSASEADIRSIFAAVQPMVHPSLRYEACAAIDRASFDLAAGDSDGAAALGKRAILLLQDRKDSRDIARAYRIIALVELSREKVSDAIDYIGFAAESADHAGEAAEAVLVDACSACIQFVWGNLGKAEREIASAGRRAAALNLDRWERWSRFFGARLRFETGRYQEAMEILDSIAANAGSRLEEAEKRILDAWSFRTRAYASSPYADLESRLDRSGDASFFAIEARFIEGDFKRSVEAADAFLTRPQAPSGVRPFCSPELPDWSSGFAMIEDRVAAAEGARERLARSFRALSLSALGSGLEARDELRRLVKDERLSELDPNAAFYSFAYSRALKAAGADVVDAGTALSVAFKRLQRRSSRIDEPEAKRSFISLSRWNVQIYADAKAHNLI
ncbi:MAG: hypothetical protein A2413_17945 [Treponema sp. RIFOXYC1_FULL_61_9]|nr:MAG: hypothetical protein A2413_17945 [Treponema sp. RIFOXYC1_FULL_61_9]